MKNNVKPVTSRRLIANPQSKGNLGKSTEVEFRVAWLDHHTIQWSGSDLDDRHTTFHSRHPDQTQRYMLGNMLEAKSAFSSLFRRVLRETAPVHIVDTRAQSDEMFVAAVEELDFFARCLEQGIRMTFVLFPSDEFESMSNFASLVQFAGDAVDYVVVRNPARSRGDLYSGSRLEKTLSSVGAKSIIMPSLLPDTLLSMEHAEAIEGRSITFAEFAVAGSTFMDPVLIGDLQWAMSNMFQQYDKIADLLLPDALAKKVQVIEQGNKLQRNKVKKEDLGLNFSM